MAVECCWAPLLPLFLSLLSELNFLGNCTSIFSRFAFLFVCPELSAFRVLLVTAIITDRLFISSVILTMFELSVASSMLQYWYAVCRVCSIWWGQCYSGYPAVTGSQHACVSGCPSPCLSFCVCLCVCLSRCVRAVTRVEHSFTTDDPMG